MATPKGYSLAQISLHWIIAALILFQLVFGDAIGGAWRSVRQGAVPEMGAMVWAHIGVGVTVLLLVLWRISLRMARGVPAEAEAGTALTRFAAKVVHLGLYLLVLALPITGLAAWFGGITSAADVHELMKPLLILLIALHVIGALWHQFVLKDNLLARMKRPG